MAQGDLLTATRYNNIQTDISLVLGNGSGNFGYGQTVESVQVQGGNVKLVEATDMQKLYNDLIKCRVHQTGLLPSDVIANVQPGDLITDDTGGTDTPGVLPADGDLKGYVNYEDLTATIKSDAERFKLATSQAENLELKTSTNQPVSSTKSSAWTAGQDNLVHEFSVNFTNYDHARHYFNAGGRINMQAEVAQGTTQNTKQRDWYLMLLNMGIISFGPNATTSQDPDADGDTVYLNRNYAATNIGFWDLTETNQVVYSKEGELGSVYAENDYTIYARRDAVPADPTTGVFKIYIRIEFNDDDQGDDQIADGYNYATDESVTAPVKSIVKYFRPSGDYVDVAAPTGTNISTL